MDQNIEMMDGPNDPRRCQGMTALKGQCQHKAMPNVKYCKVHGGSSQSQRIALRNYQLAIWQERVGQFADNDQLKSLREEIGISRLTLESILMQCKTVTDLILNSNRIAMVVSQIERLVKSCHGLEKSTGFLLDKTAALHLASVIVEIISQEVDDPEAVERISGRVISEIANAQPDNEED